MQQNDFEKARDLARRFIDASDNDMMNKVRLPGKGNSNSHGARPVHLIVTMV